ncbi:MAG: cytochrome C [Planctomycetota bacterium]|jgi:hypothetical protein
MEHAKHIIRAVLLLVAAAVAFVVVRHFMIPESFGEHGHYRFGSVADYAGKEPVHGARVSCAGCHDEEAGTVSDGKHDPVACEVCHGPLATHVRGGERIAEMPVRRTHSLCGWCHERLVARPKKFPQVDMRTHVADKGGEMIEGICLECHDAHDPTP